MAVVEAFGQTQGREVSAHKADAANVLVSFAVLWCAGPGRKSKRLVHNQSPWERLIFWLSWRTLTGQLSTVSWHTQKLNKCYGSRRASMWQGVTWCLVIAAVYVSCLYLKRTPASRQHPATVKWRITSVLIASSVAWVPVWIRLKQVGNSTDGVYNGGSETLAAGKL